MHLEKTDNNEIKKHQILAFELADHQMGFNSTDVSAVTRLLTITPLTGSADFFVGLINLRGQLTPVIDLRSLFKFSSKEPDDQTCLIAVKGEGHTLCVMADRFPALLTIETDHLEKPPVILFDRFIETVYKKDEKLILILDTRKLVDPEEIQEIMTTKEKDLKIIQ